MKNVKKKNCTLIYCVYSHYHSPLLSLLILNCLSSLSLPLTLISFSHTLSLWPTLNFPSPHSLSFYLYLSASLHFILLSYLRLMHLYHLVFSLTTSLVLKEFRAFTAHCCCHRYLLWRQNFTTFFIKFWWPFPWNFGDFLLEILELSSNCLGLFTHVNMFCLLMILQQFNKSTFKQSLYFYKKQDNSFTNTHSQRPSLHRPSYLSIEIL